MHKKFVVLCGFNVIINITAQNKNYYVPIWLCHTLKYVAIINNFVDLC